MHLPATLYAARPGNARRQLHPRGQVLLALKLATFVRNTDLRFQTEWQPVLFAPTPRLGPSTTASGSSTGSGSQQLLPEAALYLPVEQDGEREQVVNLEGVAAAHRPRQEQDRFLNVGRQAEQGHHLGD